MRIEAVRGDLTTQQLDAIVNPGNCSLFGRAGSARSGCPLAEACDELRLAGYPLGLDEGDAFATTGGDLLARWVIHTAGPVYDQHPDGGADLLAACHTRSLEVADEIGATSVGFPAISCGAHGWGSEDAAPIAVGAVRAYAAAHPDTPIRLVRFVLFGPYAVTAFERACSTVQ